MFCRDMARTLQPTISVQYRKYTYVGLHVRSAAAPAASDSKWTLVYFL